MTLRIERASGMTLRIESASDGPSTTIRLIGHMRSEHLDALQAQIKNGGSRIVLDLEEVRLVDIEVVRFLGKCQAAGIRLVHCARYINDWIDTERSSET
jgi:anti-anti-sigma regulatory factor